MNRLLAALIALALGLAGCAEPPAPEGRGQPSADGGGLPASGNPAATVGNLEGTPTPVAGLVIANARIIDGAGTTIESGSVVVRDGRIVSVEAGAANVADALVIDASGRTVMPGFIDAHRHIIQGDAETWLDERAAQSMREFLEAGFTTVLSAGDNEAAILELRRRTAAGEIVGPRIIAAGRAPLSAAPGGGGGGVDPARTDVSRPPLRPTEAAPAVPPEQSRARVQQIADAGFDAVKSVIITTPNGPETDTLRLIAAESERLGLRSITHAVTVIDTLAAVAAGTHYLVHTPHIGMLTQEEAQRIAGSGIPMVSTLGIFVPFYDENNQPIFRDALPFPWDTISSAGQGPVNARLLWEAGVVYGFGTDTRYQPRETLKHEIKTLFLVFSEQDILRIMTRNSAAAIDRADELGTLEPGKIADLVLLDGNPEQDIFDLLEVDLVIKEGAVVLDAR
jgi:imidazolonepropionase-like amidohydrolase